MAPYDDMCLIAAFQKDCPVTCGTCGIDIDPGKHVYGKNRLFHITSLYNQSSQISFLYFQPLHLLDNPRCRDTRFCNGPGALVNNSIVDKSLLELFPNGCNELPINHNIHLVGSSDLKRECPKSCGCKKCKLHNGYVVCEQWD